MPRFPTALFLATLVSAPALAGKIEKVHVDDLDPAVLPDDLGWDVQRSRLIVDGQLVKGRRSKQLAYVGEVLDEAPSLRLEDRSRHLRRKAEGQAVASGAMWGVFGAILIPAPVVAIPVGVAALTTEVVGVAGAVRAHRRFDDEALAQQIDLLHRLEQDAQASLDEG